MKRLTGLGTCAFVCIIAVGGAATRAESLTALGATYTQKFDGGSPGNLAAAGTTGTSLPGDWKFSEIPSNATYGVSTGSNATGDTYSFGATANTERAFGTLFSGSLTPTIGVLFTNDTAASIASVAISYTGEQWRLGALAREDRLDFQYSLDATSLTTGTWTDINSLDFVAPTQGPTIGALNGNDPLNQSLRSGAFNVNVAAGATFWLRWNDFNATGSDDGLAVDEFNLTPSADPIPAVPVPLAAVAGMALFPLAVFGGIRRRR